MANFSPRNITALTIGGAVLVGGLLSLQQAKETTNAPDADAEVSLAREASRPVDISINSSGQSLKLDKSSYRAGSADRKSNSDRMGDITPSITATPEPGDGYVGESLVGIEPGFDPVVTFAVASSEFGVPENLLKAVAFVESRMDHKSGTASPRGGRGVMGLREADAVDTLGEAADLLGAEKKILVLDPAQNVRGAAALLKKYYDEASPGAGHSSAAWQIAVSRYSGLPAEEAVTYGQHIENILREGMEFTTTDGAVVTIPAESHL